MGVKSAGSGDRGLRVVAVLGVLLAAGGIALWIFAFNGELDTYGPSMRPTLQGRADVEVDDDAYSVAAPRLGDIVVAQAPAGVVENVCAVRPTPEAPCAKPVSGYSATRVIKRIVGLPGDRIGFSKGGFVIRNGIRASEPYVRPCPTTCALPRPVEVPAGYYFLAGDNRRISSDSRDWGPVPRSAIDGRIDDPGG